MPIKIETYQLEELPSQTSSNTGYYKDKKNNDISTDKTIKKNSSVTQFKPFIGILVTFFHAVFTQIVNVIVKRVSYVGICQLALLRYIWIFVCSLPLSILCTNQILGEKRSRGLLVLRTVIATIGLISQITAYRYLQLVQASIVMSTLPIVTAISARIILKERFGIVQTISLIITVSGVLLSIRLPEVLLNSNNFRFDVPYLIGYAAAIGFVLCISLANVLTRKLKKTHFSILLLYSGFIGMVETATVNASMFSFVPADCGCDTFLYLMQAIFGFAALVLVTLALQHEPAGLFAIQKSSFEILVMTVFQIILFHKYPDWYEIAGACLVLISLALLGMKIILQMMPESFEVKFLLLMICIVRIGVMLRV